MLCTIIDIRGDYATVKYDQTGVESEVAIALLPFGVDVGDRLQSAVTNGHWCGGKRPQCGASAASLS